ncbi:MAG: hypothetical protein CMF58_02780 [Lentimicrobiaceae bacterium]|jgi:hypothetical protein|nr:hypothetical protein [Lentimicrobiaceae bacterium]MDG1900759.1 T9SS type A sorting domain-containing protein [Bacteroidales bacterium]MDG2080785.1 T9SS type A sorting domain-containing protein [Bacteroidales bacterium]
MKKLYNLLFVLSVPFILVLYSYSDGSPGGKTGSMGDNGATCTGCHTGSAQAQGNWIETNIPDAGFIAGETYTITAKGTHEGVVKFGFELTAEDAFGNKKGTFTITESTRTKLCNANKAVTHTANGNVPTGNANSWSMDWTAPDPAPDLIKFYAAFNAGNGDGTTSNDVVFQTELTVPQFFTNIADNYLEENTSFYPNPTTGPVTIEAPMGSNLQIIDMNGRVILNSTISKSKTNINLNHLDRGIYIMQHSYQGGLSNDKIILN